MTVEKKKRSTALHRLTARQAETLGPGFHKDGGGLNLRVSKTGSRKWELRHISPLTGKRVDMGLGSAAKGFVSLATARQLAAKARELLARGLDPRAESAREAKERKAAAAKAAPMTFGRFAEQWMAENVSQHRNPKHRAQWFSTVRGYGAPLWHNPVALIGTDDILNVLRPIWNKTPETAKRLQGRIEKILNAARAAGHRTGENPAAWRGHLETLLPRRKRGENQPAVPHRHAPEVVRAIRARDGVSALGLEFLILTAVRSGMVRGMTWGELSDDGGTWTIPAGRMKIPRPLRVPLSARARAIIRECESLRSSRSRDALVFPGQRDGRPMSDMTLSAVLKRMRKNDRLRDIMRDDETGRDAVVHGFRSTFRDWAEDAAGFPARTIEAALAHTLKDKSEAAYRRGDAFDARAPLMDAWDRYLNDAQASNVIPLGRRVQH